MTEAVQDQDLQFWDLWKKSQAPDASMEADKSTAPTQEDFDGSVPHPDETPGKYPRPSTKGGEGCRGRGKGQQQSQRGAGGVNGGSSWHHKSGGDDARMRAPESQVQSLAKLAVRHEDVNGVLRHEFSYVVHARVAPPTGVVKPLFKMQQAWRELRDKDPAKVTGPLRMALITCLFKELQNRVTLVLADEQLRAFFIKMGFLSTDCGFWPYVRWSPEKKQLEQESTRPGVPTQILQEHVASVIKLVQGSGHVARFHPIRPLTEAPQGESLVFLLQTSIGSEEQQQLNIHLRALCHFKCDTAMLFHAAARPPAEIGFGQLDCKDFALEIMVTPWSYDCMCIKAANCICFLHAELIHDQHWTQTDLQHRAYPKRYFCPNNGWHFAAYCCLHVTSERSEVMPTLENFIKHHTGHCCFGS